MIRVFISYRHLDEPGISHRLYDYLVERLDSDYVFIDLNKEFDNLSDLTGQVKSSDVLLVMIGSKWIELTQEKLRKSAYETDWVRTEIETGLETDGVLVIPILINGTNMPSAQDIPGTIQTIIGKRASLLSDTKFKEDSAELLQRIMDRHKRWCGATRVYDNFPTDAFVKRLLKAREQVQIVVIWSSLFGRLQRPLSQAVQNGASVQILLLNPDSICAVQRSRDLNEEDNFTSEKIHENIRELKQQYRALRRNGVHEGAITVKVYDATPSRTLYIAGETALIGTHPPRIKSVDSPHTEVFGKDTSLFKSVKEHFDALWEIGVVIPLDQTATL